MTDMFKSLIVYGILTLNGHPLENQGLAIYGNSKSILAETCTNKNGQYRLEIKSESNEYLTLVCKAWSENVYFSASYPIIGTLDSIQKNISINQDSLIEIVFTSDLRFNRIFPEWICLFNNSIAPKVDLMRISCPEAGRFCCEVGIDEQSKSVFVAKGEYYISSLSVSSTSFSLDNKHAHHIIVNKFRRININKKRLFIKRKKHIKLLYR